MVGLHSTGHRVPAWTPPQGPLNQHDRLLAWEQSETFRCKTTLTPRIREEVIIKKTRLDGYKLRGEELGRSDYGSSTYEGRTEGGKDGRG